MAANRARVRTCQTRGGSGGHDCLGGQACHSLKDCVCVHGEHGLGFGGNDITQRSSIRDRVVLCSMMMQAGFRKMSAIGGLGAQVRIPPRHSTADKYIDVWQVLKCGLWLANKTSAHAIDLAR